MEILNIKLDLVQDHYQCLWNQPQEFTFTHTPTLHQSNPDTGDYQEMHKHRIEWLNKRKGFETQIITLSEITSITDDSSFPSQII